MNPAGPVDPQNVAALVERAVSTHFGAGVRIQAIYLFGSLAANGGHEWSDADLAILSERPLDPVRLYDAAEDVAAECRRDVDLVDLKRASTVFAVQIISKGRRLVTNDMSATSRFEAETLADYADLCDHRKPAVDAFMDRVRGSEGTCRGRRLIANTITDEFTRDKIAINELCLARVREETSPGLSVLDDQTIQDAVVLNIQRACETAIDLAMHVVASRQLGVPQGSRHAFELLRDAGLLEPELADRLRRMVGFRNIAVHQYQRLSRPILESVVRDRMSDFTSFTRTLLDLK